MLSFNNDDDFILQHNLSYRRVTIAACCIILVAFTAFSFWDVAIIGWDHPRIMEFILYRHLVGDPLVVATLVYCFRQKPKIRLDWLMTVNLLLVGNSILIMYILMFEINVPSQIEGISVFILGTLFLPSIFYYQKLIVCSFAAVSYLAVLIAYDQGSFSYTHATIYLSIICTAGIVHSLSFDRKNRSDFEKTAILQSLAHTDQLTGTENRHKFDEDFHLLLDKAQKEQQSFALAITDIDYFKQYNDNYGHLVGDECLKKIAMALSNEKQHREDRVVRFGGEEFIVVKYGLHAEELESWANRLPKLISNLQIPHKGSEQDSFVTISVGISYWSPQCPKSRRQLMSEADEALYKAKSQGRNQALIAS